MIIINLSLDHLMDNLYLSKINEHEILVFILCTKNQSKKNFLFDIKHLFESNYACYKNVAKEIILKAIKGHTTIIGLISNRYKILGPINNIFINNSKYLS